MFCLCVCSLREEKLFSTHFESEHIVILLLSALCYSRRCLEADWKTVLELLNECRKHRLQWSGQVCYCSCAQTSATLAALWLFSSCPLSGCFASCATFCSLLIFTCFVLEVFEATQFGISRHECFTGQWKYCLIKCCSWATTLIFFKNFLTLYP